MSPMQALQALILFGVVAVAAIRWQRAILLAIPFLITLNGVAVPFGGASIRLDQLAACALMIPLVASIAARRRTLIIDRPAVLLLAIFAMNVVSSAINSPAPGYSLQQCVSLAATWMIYLVIVNYVRTAELLRAMVVRALLAATIASAVAVLAFMGASLGLSIPGADLSSGAALDLTRPFGAFGTMVEPNILGSYCAAFLVLGYGLYLAMRNEEDSNLRRLGRWTSLTCAVALVVSFTRSAWIGALVGIVVLAVLTRRLEGVSLRRVLVPVAVVVGAAGLVLLIPGTASAFLLYKITNILNPESPTVIWRLLTSVLALDQTSVHPIIGHGTFSFAPLVAEGTDFARYAGWRSIWISNFLLLALHDTGVIGLVLWVALLWAFIAPGWRAARKPADVTTDFSAPLTAAFVALLLPFLATTGFSLGYPWLLAGLLAAQAQLTKAHANG